MPDPELEELIEEYNRVDAERREFDEKMRNESDPRVRSDLESQRYLRDQQRRGLKFEIEGRGGSVEPPPPQQHPEPAAGSGSPEPQVFLKAPPESIDEEWNSLVHSYESALERAAEHATMQKDDWGCGEHCRGANHDGCSIWWRGHLQNLLSWVRYTSFRLLEDLAGPSTVEELATRRRSESLQQQIDQKSEELAPAEKKYDELVARFQEEEKTHEAIREAGGDVAPYTGVIKAGRERLLFDIEEARKAKNRIFAERHELLAKLLAQSGEDIEIRRERGLERSNDRYGWDDVNLDYGGLDDSELLKLLLGPAQYEAMKAEEDKQGLQRQHDREAPAADETSMMDDPAIESETSAGKRSSSALMVTLGVLAVVLLVTLGMLFLGGDDSALDGSTSADLAATGTQPETEDFEGTLGPSSFVVTVPTQVASGANLPFTVCSFETASGDPRQGEMGFFTIGREPAGPDASHASGPLGSDGCFSGSVEVKESPGPTDLLTSDGNEALVVGQIDIVEAG